MSIHARHWKLPKNNLISGRSAVIAETKKKPTCGVTHW